MSFTLGLPITMCDAENMIEITFIGLTAAATFFAAFSAWMSYRVSDRSLSFQKNYSKNQQLITKLNSIISKLRTVKHLTSNPLKISDEQFGTIEPLFLEARLELEKLEETGVFNYRSHKISEISSLREIIDQMSPENTYITEVIQALETKIDEIFM